ncbi:uncharacterized protein [Spinacia oleracea]|uniref:Reverse transcriptase domain-containing protein n=1 Tax=Spinacia oleracea TaxID=3562 RepID=A0A9R0JEG0_SPIOL|nr:uncharacterized protein LOC110803719 [Spinacia oleracea]
MEPLWYSQPGFSNTVNLNGKTNTIDYVDKLIPITRIMSSWVKDNIGNIFKKRKHLSARLNGIHNALETRPTCMHLLDLNGELSSEINLIFQQEEAFWMTRARTNWIKCGEQNTTYFHRSVTIRRKRNKITTLNSEVGQVIEGDDLVPHIMQYFSTLFTSESTMPTCDNHHYLNTIAIDHPATVEEVGREVFELGPFKSPGIDGFHAHFYQQH